MSRGMHSGSTEVVASAHLPKIYRLAVVVVCFATTVAGVVDLKPWKLTLPIKGKEGKPKEVTSVERFTLAPYYYRKADGVCVFVTPVNGYTTPNTKYPRTELRELTANGELAKWSTTRGTHTLIFTASVQKMPKVKPDIAVGQIHGADDDVFQLRVRRGGVQLVWDDDDQEMVVDKKYILGTRFSVQITVSNGIVKVYYNDFTKPAVTYKSNSKDCYFKLGNYLQTNPKRGDNPKDYGEVWVYSLSVSHT